MTQRSSGPAEPGGGRAAEPVTDDWDDDDDEWPDDLWPGDDDSPTDPAGSGSRGAAWPPAPWPAPPARQPSWRRLHPAALVAMALTAAGIGAGIALAVHGLSSGPATPASQPAATAPAQPGGNGVPGSSGGGALPGAGGAGAEMFIGGEVTAVTSTSITIGGPGRDVTAAVTGSTRFTGKVTSISGIKVGDEVSAQLTQSGGTTTAVTITDPAQPPAGGTVP